MLTAARETAASNATVASTDGKIVCRNLVKRFLDTSRGEEVMALRSIDLEVSGGEILAVLGPSGCGKTTLLNIIAGFEALSSGELNLDGRSIAGPGPDRGVVFQEYALFPWLSVFENVEFGLRERGMPRRERREKAAAAIASVGLVGFERRFPRELSGGMRQRVGIARVLVNDPKILLMDEPFAALDAQTRSLMQQELLAVWEATRRSIVFVTHNIEEAVLLGDRVVVMTARPGRIKKIVPVDLDRPRDVTSPGFNAVRRAVSDLLEEEVMRAFAAMKATP